VSFDVASLKLCLSTALEFSDGGLPIGDIRFKSMTVTFCAELGDELAFTAAGEIVMFYDIYPPLEIFNTMFGWLKPSCNKVGWCYASYPLKPVLKASVFGA